MVDYLRRENIVRLLLTWRESEAEAFFFSVGLSAEYRAPGPGWGRQKRLLAALAGAEERGDLDTVMELIEARLSSRQNVVGGSGDSVAVGVTAPEPYVYTTPIPLGGANDRATGPNGPIAEPTTSSTAVFVAHGKNKLATAEVARLIERVGRGRLDAIVLEEQATASQTVIEKFEDFAAIVGFAVVMLTADDFGRDLDEVAEKSRARQNVVFELGYLMGSLGRRRVVVLSDVGVAMPTQIAGIVCTRLDNEGMWKHLLAKEMHNAGLSVDFSRIA